MRWFYSGALLLALLLGCSGGARGPENGPDIAVTGTAGQTIATKAQKLASGQATVEMRVVLPKDHVFTEGFAHQVMVEDGISETAWQLEAADLENVIEIPITVRSDLSELSVSLRIGHCEKADLAVCFVHSTRLAIPVSVASRSPDRLLIDYTVQ